MLLFKKMRRSERIADRFLKAGDARGFWKARRDVLRYSDAFEHTPVKCRADVVLKLKEAAGCLEVGAGTECLGPLLRSLAVPANIDAAWLAVLRARLSIIEEYADTEYPANLLRSIVVGVERSKLA